MAVSIDKLTNEIVNELRRYTNIVEEEVEQAKKDVAKDSAKKLKQTSPVKTGEYASGWSTKKKGEAVVVYNKKKGQLTHLLEKGHAIANGTGRVAPKVHIKPVEEKAIEEFTKRVENAIRQ